jgi:hypothetical protein
MMQVNKRVFAVEQAKTDLLGAMLEIEKKHKLTASEMFLIIADYTKLIASQCVRAERQENGEKNE